ncbi:Pyruvate/Phosphoenolpyruvate kinase-like domain-containing protein [Obelidium mucronatum]|nr:Pyruvate/Phosphoenolpyruvate kinase-like domain-containing protein [Obelidium mucronatum]
MIRAAGAQFRRSALLYIPGSDARKLAKGLGLGGVDTRVLDLEDSVALHRKAFARAAVADALAGLSQTAQTQETCVRINSVASGLAHADLAAVLRQRAVDSVLVPKVGSPADVAAVAAALDAHADVRRDVKILASIETARGLLSLPAILAADAAAATPRIAALVFAAEDYVADLGLVRTRARTELLLARQMVVAHAVAYGLQAIDLVCVDFKDSNILQEECTEGRQFGFTGKQAIHPNQVEIIQKTFSPTEKEISYAKQILEANEIHKSKGAGAFDLDGKMVDAPVILWAQRILAKAGQWDFIEQKGNQKN